MDGNASSSNAISCKVVLLGETGVGKTSIMSRYVNNTFSSNLMSTAGASFATKTMYIEKFDKNLKFEIWDTAGQERYRSLAKIYYKDASVAILVYDITRKQSFDEIKKYWIEELKENATKRIILVLAANKADMYEVEEIEENVGRAFAKEIGAVFKYTSAKNSTGIDELFRLVGMKYIDPNYEEASTNSSVDEQELTQRRIRISKLQAEKGNKKCCKS